MVRKKIGRDKWQHFFVGIGMGNVLQTVMWYLFPREPVWATVIAFIFVIIIGYGFEVYSKFTGKGHYEFNDAVASIVGGVLGIAIILIVELGISS